MCVRFPKLDFRSAENLTHVGSTQVNLTSSSCMGFMGERETQPAILRPVT